jgi:electron transport complex protein RnfB
VSGDGVHSNRPKVAFVIEEDCIGCTKCIQACPVDAIIGAAKQMHTIIIDECTGCDLCVAPCPVDCIEMRELPDTINNWQWDLTSIPVKQLD